MRPALMLTIVLVLMNAPQAGAASLGVSGQGLSYAAAAGERNQVVGAYDLATRYPYDLVMRDAGAVVTAGLGCRSVDAHTVRCPATPPAGGTRARRGRWSWMSPTATTR